MAAASTIVAVAAVAAAATGVYSAVEQRKQAKQSAKERKEAGKVSAAEQSAQQQEQRRQQIREERVRRAQILQSAETTGVTGSAGALGSVSALGTSTGANISSMSRQANAAAGIGAASQRAANADLKQQEAAALGSIAGSVFSAAVGAGALDVFNQPTPLTKSPATDYRPVSQINQKGY